MKVKVQIQAKELIKKCYKFMGYVMLCYQNFIQTVETANSRHSTKCFLCERSRDCGSQGHADNKAFRRRLSHLWLCQMSFSFTLMSWKQTYICTTSSLLRLLQRYTKLVVNFLQQQQSCVLRFPNRRIKFVLKCKWNISGIEEWTFHHW